MKVVLEFEGAVADESDACYAAHAAAAEASGWAKLDQASFWRLMRSQGPDAVFLRGAKPLKLKEYHEAFQRLIAEPSIHRKLVFPDHIQESLRRVCHVSDCTIVTLHDDTDSIRSMLTSQLSGTSLPLVVLSSIPGMRVGQLRDLAGDARQRVFVATSDALIRAGNSADYLTVGLSSGRCGRKRLEQAGASVILRDLEDFAECLAAGGKELLDAGLMPFSTN